MSLTQTTAGRLSQVRRDTEAPDPRPGGIRERAADGVRPGLPNRRLDEVRTWFLDCTECGHTGEVVTTLRRLRAAWADGRLYCHACGVACR